MTSLWVSNWPSYGFLDLQVSFTLLWIWECQLTLYFINFGCQLFRAELYKITIAISLVEICFCAGQLGFLSLYGKFSFRPSHLINFGASLMIVTHLLRWFQIPFSKVFWRTFDFHFHFDWNATSNTTVQNDCRQISSIEFLILDVFEYIDSLCIKYHLLSVVIIVQMFANVFNYDLITKTSEWDFQETFNNTKATNEEIDSSFMLTRLTFACLRIGIAYSLPMSIVITYILAFFRTPTVNSANVFLMISTI